MAKRHIDSRNFSAGLNDKANEDGMGLEEGFAVFENVRTSRGVATSRPRFARIAVTGNDNQALSFDGVDDYINVTIAGNTKPWEWGLKFTVEMTWSITDKTASNTFLYGGITTPHMVVDVSSSKVRVRVWDSAAALTTLTSTADCPESTTFTLQIVRDGASLSLSIDNGTADSTSMSASNVLRTPAGEVRIGRDSGSNYTSGTWDTLRVHSVARSDHNNRLVRNANPRAESTLLCYDCRIATGDLVRDRSRFEAHGEKQGAPTEVTALSHPHAIVHTCCDWRNDDNQVRALILSGGRLYDVGI